MKIKYTTLDGTKHTYTKATVIDKVTTQEGNKIMHVKATDEDGNEKVRALRIENAVIE